jgi:hypothetical protein
MSYFICGLGAPGTVTGVFERIISETAPTFVNADTLQIKSAESCFGGYDGKKVIRDFLIRNDENGSWLAAVGTPLVSSATERDSLLYLNDYLNDPAGLLLEKMDGAFAVFGYDAPKNRLIVATDFNSSIPIFYTTKGGKVLFCSHELALAKLVNAELDPFGFSQSVHLGAAFGSHTRFRDIHKMLPCQVCFTAAGGELRMERYWQPRQETPLLGGLDDHIEKWNAELREAVQKYHECSGRKPVIVDFTAGEDGRLLVAQCHALGIPFKAHVTGLPGDTDVVIAKQAAAIAGFELMVRPKHHVAAEQLLANASKISLRNDAYQDFFKSCTEFATDIASPLDDYSTVKFCGLPGGEAFRGSYYFRGKAFFPSRKVRLDDEFFTRMKFLLDFHPDLLKHPDQEFLGEIRKIVRENLQEAEDFPVGTQIDHLLRVFQTCLLGLKYKNPLYLPYASRQMTRSIYWLSPAYKQGGRLTKACTEMLFPKLARVKTQNGVPTIRKTIPRLPLFLPEHLSMIRKVSSGLVSRLFKWTKPNKWYYSDEWTALIVKTVLNEPPYSNWFSSSSEMASGHLYNPLILNPLLQEAKAGNSRYIPILGRVINNELAYRWVSNL